jgi:hypothetical protein
MCDVTSWWYGEIVGAASLGYVIGFLHHHVIIALLSACMLETTNSYFFAENDNASLLSWTLLVAISGTMVGSAGVITTSRRARIHHRDDRSSFSTVKFHVGQESRIFHRTTLIVILSQMLTYMVCRRLIARIAFNGFPFGAMVAMGTLAVLCVCIAMLMHSHVRPLSFAVACGVGLALLSTLLVYGLSSHCVPPWPWTVLAGVGATVFALGLMVFGTWVAYSTLDDVISGKK